MRWEWQPLVPILLLIFWISNSCPLEKSGWKAGNLSLKWFLLGNLLAAGTRSYYRPRPSAAHLLQYQSCCCLHQEGRWRAPCVGLSCGSIVFRNPPCTGMSWWAIRKEGWALCCLEAQGIALPQRTPEPSLALTVLWYCGKAWGC